MVFTQNFLQAQILSFGVATFVGVVLNQHLQQLLVFPFGDLFADFLGAFSTAVLTVCLTFFLEHSTVMKKVWDFLNKIKSYYEHTLDYYKQINQALDKYLLELARVEFNLSPQELYYFANQLTVAGSDEVSISAILNQELSKRKIELPYKEGDIESLKSWLRSKQ